MQHRTAISLNKTGVSIKKHINNTNSLKRCEIHHFLSCTLNHVNVVVILFIDIQPKWAEILFISVLFSKNPNIIYQNKLGLKRTLFNETQEYIKILYCLIK